MHVCYQCGNFLALTTKITLLLQINWFPALFLFIYNSLEITSLIHFPFHQVCTKCSFTKNIHMLERQKKLVTFDFGPKKANRFQMKLQGLDHDFYLKMRFSLLGQKVFLFLRRQNTSIGCVVVCNIIYASPRVLRWPIAMSEIPCLRLLIIGQIQNQESKYTLDCAPVKQSLNAKKALKMDQVASQGSKTSEIEVTALVSYQGAVDYPMVPKNKKKKRIKSMEAEKNGSLPLLQNTNLDG